MWLTDAWLRASHLELSSRFRSSGPGEREPLAGGRSAVHGDGGARHEGRFVAREEQDGPRDLIRIGGAPIGIRADSRR